MKNTSEYDKSRAALQDEAATSRRKAWDLEEVLGRAQTFERIANQLLEIHGPTLLGAAAGQSVPDCIELTERLRGLSFRHNDTTIIGPAWQLKGGSWVPAC